jgi:hypothetical protein
MRCRVWGGKGPFGEANATTPQGAAGAEGKGMGWDGDRVVVFFVVTRERGGRIWVGGGGGVEHVLEHTMLPNSPPRVSQIIPNSFVHVRYTPHEKGVSK